MTKPKKWDMMTQAEREAWREKVKEGKRIYHLKNREKVIESQKKYRDENPEKVLWSRQKYFKLNTQKERFRKNQYQKKIKQQSAADQFFQLAGAAEQITKIQTE